MIVNRLKLVSFVVFVLFTISFLCLNATPTLATAGINETINFQGKVTNLSGTNVTNGSYDFVFRLYKASSGGGAVWTETWNGGSQVAVTDGVFKVALGSISTISSLDWNDDSWYLSVEFNGDGEMSTRIRLTSSPYAMNAKKVAGLTVQDSAGGADTTGTLKVADAKTITFVDDFTTAGAFGLTLTTTGTTNVTLPTTGTLATLAGSEQFTNKTIGSTGLTFSGATTDITTTGGEALVLNGNAASTFQTSAGSITLQAAGTGTISTVQIGAGGSGSTTPDFLGLDVKSDTGDPAGGFEGAIYYNTFDNKFRCYQDAAWTDCIGSGGTPLWSGIQTPTGNLALGHAEYTTAFTWDTAATAATLDAFTLALTNDASTDANTQRLFVLNNNDDGGATGTTERFIVLDNKDSNEAVTTAIEILASSTGTVTTAIDVSDGEIGTALAIGSNDVTVGGVTLSSTELALLDSGVALSELTDSGTLTAGTVDINGGAIDGVTIGGSSAGAGTFTTLTTTGTVDLSSDAGADTITIGQSGGTDDTVTIAGNISLTDDQWSVSAAGVGSFITGSVLGSQTFTTNNIADSGALTIKSASGANDLTLDSGTVGGVNIGTGNNAKTIAIGTGTAGNIINIGTNNTTSDTISIGSALDNVAITGDQWSVTDAGVLTVISCSGCGTGSSLWSGLGTPTGDLNLSMAAYNTAFTWDPGANAIETAFTLNFDGEDSAADEDQVLMALNQTSNGTDVTEAADALLTLTNSDANDPVENAIRFDAGAAGTDFTYGINFDAATFGTAEFILQNGETIDNVADGTIAFTSAITVSSNIDTQGTIQAGSGNVTLTDATGNILESIIADGSVLARVAGTETITGGWTFNTAATTFTTAIQANGGVTTSTTNTALTLSANGSGDIVFSNDADTNVQITAGAASGVDLLGVSTNSNSVTTTAVDGVQIDFANGGAGALDNSGLRINMTSNNNNASTTLEALVITGITGQASATEYALTIGSGWDRGLSVASASTFTAALTSEATTVVGSSGNTFTFNPASGPLYAGTARPTKRITIEPEYPGATFTADGAANTGSMTSDNMTSSPYRNFYKWTNTQGTAQDYDVWVRIPLPADFAAMAATPTLSIDTYTSDTTNGTVLVTVYDTSNSADCTSAAFTPTSTTTWQSKTQTTCLDTGTYAANGVITVAIKVTGAATSGDTRISTIYFDYLAKF